MSARAALALTIANVAAGVFNYLYQVHAATVLDTTSFGLLSAWLAQTTLVGTVATVIQYISLDMPIREAPLGSLVRTAGIVSLGVVVSLVILENRYTPLLFGIASVFGSVLLYAIIGQLQARLRLGDAAITIIIVATLRFALPFAWPRSSRALSFYMAQAVCSYAAIVVAAIVFSVKPEASAKNAGFKPTYSKVSTSHVGSLLIRLARPILLAFATVVFPLIDILAVSSTHDAATTGAFSRIALAARMVFFGGAALLQVLLPHELHAARTRAPLPGFVVRMQRLLAPTLVIVALLFALTLDHAILRPQGQERIWLFGSCLRAAFLIALLSDIQTLAVRSQLRTALACVAGVLATSTAAAAAAYVGGGTKTVIYYVFGALIGDTLNLAFVRLQLMRSKTHSCNLRP